jgi:hypothetical protein
MRPPVRPWRCPLRLLGRHALRGPEVEQARRQHGAAVLAAVDGARQQRVIDALARHRTCPGALRLRRRTSRPECFEHGGGPRSYGQADQDQHVRFARITTAARGEPNPGLRRQIRQGPGRAGRASSGVTRRLDAAFMATSGHAHEQTAGRFPRAEAKAPGL